MANCIVIDLPWPDRALFQNSRAHWGKKARAVKSAREAAFWLAKGKGVGKWPSAVLTFAYHPPDNRQRDVQNMPEAMKAYIDGIADAMGCDDHKFRPRYPDHFGSKSKGGYVRVGVFDE